MCVCVLVYVFFRYTIARLVFSIRVTQEGFSKVSKQHGCSPLYVMFAHLSQYSFLSLCPHKMYACTYISASGPRIRVRARMYMYMRMHLFTLKSRQRSVTIFNKWISHHRSIWLTTTMGLTRTTKVVITRRTWPIRR